MKKITLLILLLSFAAQQSVAQRRKQENTPDYQLPWAPIRDNDMLWKRRVWREISIYEEHNKVFRLMPDSLVAYSFPDVLLRGLQKDSLSAYAAWDTTFQRPLSMQEIENAVDCKVASLSYKKVDTTNMPCHYPQQIAKYAIAEDWIFDRNAGKMVVHIVAIAPVDGLGNKLFWVKYPEGRYYMAQHNMYVTSEEGRMSWDRYFESRQFSSKITRVEGKDQQEQKDAPRESGQKEKNKKKKRKHPADELFKSEKDAWTY